MDRQTLIGEIEHQTFRANQVINALNEANPEFNDLPTEASRRHLLQLAANRAEIISKELRELVKQTLK